MFGAKDNTGRLRTTLKTPSAKIASGDHASFRMNTNRKKPPSGTKTTKGLGNHEPGERRMAAPALRAALADDLHT